MFEKIFKRKNKRKKVYQKNLNVTPTEYFEQFGSVISTIWGDFVRGQNLAVELFYDFRKFEQSLKNVYPVDLDRHIGYLNIENYKQEIKVEEAMYLYLLNLSKDCFVSAEEIGIVSTMALSEYKDIISELTLIEKTYCDKLKEYIESTILKKVKEVNRNRWGIEKKNSAVPLNTLDLVRYHHWLSDGGEFSDIAKKKNWNCVGSTPIVSDRITEDNPLIISSIKCLHAFMLDYLQYATIALPTFSLKRLLSYKDEKREKTIADIIRDEYGEEALDFIEYAMDEMNGTFFRITVYRGEKIT